MVRGTNHLWCGTVLRPWSRVNVTGEQSPVCQEMWATAPISTLFCASRQNRSMIADVRSLRVLLQDMRHRWRFGWASPRRRASLSCCTRRRAELPNFLVQPGRRSRPACAWAYEAIGRARKKAPHAPAPTPRRPSKQTRATGSPGRPCTGLRPSSSGIPLQLLGP